MAEIGGASLVVGDGASQETVDLLTVPEVPAAFSALTCLVPPADLILPLTLARSTYLDKSRADEPRFVRVRNVSGRL